MYFSSTQSGRTRKEFLTSKYQEPSQKYQVYKQQENNILPKNTRIIIDEILRIPFTGDHFSFPEDWSIPLNGPPFHGNASPIPSDDLWIIFDDSCIPPHDLCIPSGDSSIPSIDLCVPSGDFSVPSGDLSIFLIDSCAPSGKFLLNK